jgi:putative thioredoxin
VKAFRDGQVAEEFTGAVPPRVVEEFFDKLVPSDADMAAAEALRSGDEEGLRAVVEANPRNVEAATALARILMSRGDYDGALAVLEPIPGDFAAAGLSARAWLERAGADLSDAFAAWDAGDHASALEKLQDTFASAPDDETRDQIRRVMVAIFTELGADNDLAREHRRRLATALY